MEQVEKGLWLGVGIFFFLGAMFIGCIYYSEVNRMAELINMERERTYITEETGIEEELYFE